MQILLEFFLSVCYNRNMQIDLSRIVNSGETIAVAVSGGSDSMALLNYMRSQAKIYGIKIIALNVEHGIRGQASVSDTEFVKEFCAKNDIPLLTYAVDCPKYAEENKLSIEQAARKLRYQCFNHAISNGTCNKIATAHHSRDNLESVLLNLFRGTGIKGVSGIEENYQNKIIRPFLSLKKEQIEEYIKDNDIPFVTDQTNFCDDYTRNYIRLNVLPEIKKIFPEAESSALRFSEIASIQHDFIDAQAKKALLLFTDKSEIILPLDRAPMGYAVIYALKNLGVEKDWEKAHIDAVYRLSVGDNGKKVNLPQGIIAIKEYDRIVFYKETDSDSADRSFSVGKTPFNNFVISIEKTSNSVDLKSGFFCDKDKIPLTAVIRTKRDGDKFTKFGGGTKSLNDYLTDKKVPLRLRDNLPILADGNNVLAIFGIAVSEKIKVDETTKTILKLKVSE